MATFLWVILVVVVILSYIAMLCWVGLTKPWQRYRKTRLMFWLILPVCVAAVACGATVAAMGNTRQGLLTAFLSAGIILNFAALAFRRRGPAEIASYKLDPRHCGRCGYDLTGNTSGVCPECGWQLPPGTKPSISPLSGSRKAD